MIIPRDIFLFIDIAVIALYIIKMMVSGKRGFVLELLDMCSLIVSVIIAYMYSPVLSSKVNLIPKSVDFTGVPMLNDYIRMNVNHMAWFILIVIVLKLVCLVLKPVGELISKIPLLKDVNAIAGVFLSWVTSTIWVLFICFILGLPLFKNGQTVMNSTLLGTIKYTVTFVFRELEEPFKQSEFINKVMEDITSLSDEEKLKLEQWMGDDSIDVQWDEIFSSGGNE